MCVCVCASARGWCGGGQGRGPAGWRGVATCEGAVRHSKPVRAAGSWEVRAVEFQGSRAEQGAEQFSSVCRRHTSWHAVAGSCESSVPGWARPHRSVRRPISRSRLPSRRGVSSGLRSSAALPRRLRLGQPGRGESGREREGRGGAGRRRRLRASTVASAYDRTLLWVPWPICCCARSLQKRPAQPSLPCHATPRPSPLDPVHRGTLAAPPRVRPLPPIVCKGRWHEEGGLSIRTRRMQVAASAHWRLTQLVRPMWHPPFWEPRR